MTPPVHEEQKEEPSDYGNFTDLLGSARNVAPTSTAHSRANSVSRDTDLSEASDPHCHIVEFEKLPPELQAGIDKSCYRFLNSVLDLDVTTSCSIARVRSRPEVDAALKLIRAYQIDIAQHPLLLGVPLHELQTLVQNHQSEGAQTNHDELS